MLDSMIVISSPEQPLRTRLVRPSIPHHLLSLAPFAFGRQYRAKPRGDPRTDSLKLKKKGTPRLKNKPHRVTHFVPSHSKEQGRRKRQSHIYPSRRKFPQTHLVPSPQTGKPQPRPPPQQPHLVLKSKPKAQSADSYHRPCGLRADPADESQGRETEGVRTAGEGG